LEKDKHEKVYITMNETLNLLTMSNSEIQDMQI